jgi:hypothetical protein
MEDIHLTTLKQTQNSIDLMKLVNTTQIYWNMAEGD